MDWSKWTLHPGIKQALLARSVLRWSDAFRRCLPAAQRLKPSLQRRTERLLIIASFAFVAVPVLPTRPAHAEAASFDWVYPPAKPLQVHVCRGLWSREYRIEEALALAGGGISSNSWHTAPGGCGWLGPWGHIGGGLWRFPATAQHLTTHHVLIICNVNAQALQHTQSLLLDYAENGGSILFLGGRFAFGDSYHQSSLAKLCPVTFVEKGFDLRNPSEGLTLSPAESVLNRDLKALGWDEKPMVFWYHAGTPRANAVVAMSAGDNPLLILGQYGKGRVAVFAGSVMGVPEKGELPFWKWDGWPAVLGRTVRWLAEAPSGNPGGLGDEITERLAELAEPEEVDFEAEDDATKGKAKQTRAAGFLQSVAGRCHRAESARLFLSAAAALTGDLPSAVPVPASRAIRPQATAEFAPLAEKLISSGALYKTALGLRVLGMSRHPEVVAALRDYYSRGEMKETAPEESRGDDLGLPVPEVSPANEDRGAIIRLAAISGLGNLQDPKALPTLKKIAEESATKGKYVDTHLERNFEETISDARREYQEALMGILRCGDDTVASEIVDFMIENIYVYVRARMERNKPEDRLNRVVASVHSSMDWQQQLYEKIATVPESVLPALAKRIAAEKDSRIAPLALATFADRKLSPEVAGELRKSPVAAVRAIGAR